MIKVLNSAQNNNIRNFRSEKPFPEKRAEDETRILPNTIKTQLEQGYQKTTSAFIDYPVKGLKGDVNSNFYEFLTMGIVPYLAGSAMFMVVFNILNLIGTFGEKESKAAAKIGKKLALGVVLYGVFKELSKNLVTTPVKIATGVDTEMPYQNKVYNLPKGTGKDAEIEIQWQQRKVFDSKEFYRKDLLKRDYFDGIAKRLGLGENLNDSISETSPIIQNIVATSNTAKSLSSYSWAAVGVMLAAQDSWMDFFNSISNRKRFSAKENEGFVSKLGGRIKNFGKNTFDISKTFVKSFGRSCKELWSGEPGRSGFMKHAGKTAIITSTLLTAGLTSNVIIKAKSMAQNNNSKTIDENKESTVI